VKKQLNPIFRAGKGEVRDKPGQFLGGGKKSISGVPKPVAGKKRGEQPQTESEKEKKKKGGGDPKGGAPGAFCRGKTRPHRKKNKKLGATFGFSINPISGP